MLRNVLAAMLLVAGAAAATHAQPSLPSSFRATMIHSPEGADIFVRSGGSGPVVVLVHGYAENSDSWEPLAADLMKDHTVVVPDLRGIGRSSKPEGGYDKKTQAKDLRAVVSGLGYDRTFVVAHDIGNMVVYAYAALYPDKVERLVVMDAPIPGIEPWSEILQNPGVWHFNFHGPDAERLVAGRERIYLDRIWNDFTGDPGKPDEATRNFFTATYAQPGGMRAGFAQFAAFAQDAKDNKVFEQKKLPMPVLAVGGEKSFGPIQAVIMRHVATNVQEAVIAGSGHWLMEERPAETVALIRKFLDGESGAGGGAETRLTPAEYRFPPAGNPGTGSSGVADIRTVVLKGNPDQAGLYTIMLRVPPHTRLAEALGGIPIGRPAKPEEVADLIARACSPDDCRGAHVRGLPVRLREAPEAEGTRKATCAGTASAIQRRARRSSGRRRQLEPGLAQAGERWQKPRMNPMRRGVGG